MIKRLIYSLLIILTVIFSSCKKENYHKVRFHIEFIDVTEGGYSNFINVGCSPYYDDEEEPTLYLSLIEPGYEWDYEYWQLQDGEKVSFIHNGELWWEGDNKEILTTDNKELNDFVFSTELTRRIKHID